MIVNGEKLISLGAFRSFMTVPDCVVCTSNKIGKGNGEAKFYVASKAEMYGFYGKEHFVANCFMLKNDLLAYMDAIKEEYMNPSQPYRQKEDFPELWISRKKEIENQPDVICFRIFDQYQISGPRGYIKSQDNGYQIIRNIALPLVSYIYAEKVGSAEAPLFYWKLFVDFDAIWEKKNGPLVFTYGTKKLAKNTEKGNIVRRSSKKDEAIRRSRDGQGKYREALLEQCRICPFTMISDERLLIASHIKPWAASNDKEKVDPYNGYMLSPMYDKLFDRGYITFTEERHVILSEFISSYTWKQIGLKNDMFIKALPMDEKRIRYLEFHHKTVFKGLI